MSTVDQMWLTNYLPIRNIDNKVPDARFRTKKLLKQHRFIHAAWQKAKMSNNQISKKHAKTLKQFIDKDSALKYFTPTSEVLLKIEQKISEFYRISILHLANWRGSQAGIKSATSAAPASPKTLRGGCTSS